MPDIFDQLAAEKTPGGSGDIFDQLAAQGSSATGSLPLPHEAVQHAQQHAESFVDSMEAIGKELLGHLLSPLTPPTAPGSKPSEKPVQPATSGAPAIAPENPGEFALPARQANRVLFGTGGAETALGRAFPSLSGAKVGDTPTADLPLIRLENAIPQDSQLPQGVQEAVAATKGVLGVASDLTAPKQAELAIMTGGLGKVLPKALEAAVSGYFAYQMGHGASDAVKHAYDAYEKGDYVTMARDLGYGSAATAMAALAGWHGAKSGLKAIRRAPAPPGLPPPDAPGLRPGWSAAHTEFQSQAPTRPQPRPAPAPEESPAPAPQPQPPQAEAPPEMAPAPATPAPRRESSAPKGPKARPRASEPPTVPETGIPEAQARAMAARDDLAYQLAGKSFRELDNPDRIAIDDLISQGYQGEPIHRPTPGMPPEDASPQTAQAAEIPAAPQQSYADFLKERYAKGADNDNGTNVPPAARDEQPRAEAQGQEAASPAAEEQRAAGGAGESGQQTAVSGQQEGETKVGPHGPVFAGLRGKPEQAIAKLRKAQTGEVPGALYNPSVGDVDLIWGYAGNPKKGFSDGYGLAHIIKKHEELQQDIDLSDLPRIFPKLKVVDNDGRTIELGNETHTAGVRLDWDGLSKRWLVTAYEKREPRSGESPSGSGAPRGGGPLPPGGPTSSLSENPPAGETIDVPGTHAAERQSPPPGGSSTSLEENPAPGAVHEARGLSGQRIAAGNRPQPLSSPARDHGSGRMANGPGTQPRGSRNPLRAFAENDVVPTLKEAAETVSEAKDDVLRTVAPALRDISGKRAANVLRGNLAETQRSFDQAKDALDTERKYFDSQTPDDNYRFIDRIEHGEKQPTPEEQAMADPLRKILDERRSEVQALGKGKLNDFYQNYFPHIWEDPKKATDMVKRMLGRRPFEGGKSFLKKRTHVTFADGLKAGLKPVSDNPVELVLLKVREMDRYILAHRTLNQLEGEGLARKIAVGEQAPEGWTKVADPIGTIYGAPTVEFPHFYDLGMRDMLENLAESLGIQIQSSTRIKGSRNAAGISYTGKNTVERATASGEDILAHEIGHQLEDRFHLTDRVLAKAKNAAERRELKQEMRAIADLRMEGHEEQVSAAMKRYFHSPQEQAAAMVQAFSYMPDRMDEIAPHVFEHLMEVLHEDPALEPLLAVRPSLQLGKEMGEVPHGGLLIRAHWYLPDGAAQVLNNHLSPGLRGKGWYRVALGTNNALNQAQLGMSAFHLGFTSADATVSRAALGFKRLLQGHPIEAAKNIGSAPAAAFTTAFKGNKLLKEWYRPGSQGGEIAAIANELVHAGGRARMDDTYRTDAAKNMARAWREGDLIGAIVRLPGAALEKMAAPIMEYLVPRQKLGVFLDLARVEMHEHAGRVSKGIDEAASLEKMREQMRMAWDSVENRMGQMTYDNLFWNRTAKDLAMISTRSVGWNLGTLREVGGGLTDIVRQPLNKLQGKPVNLNRISYLLGLVTVNAMISATYQYLRTGHGPTELKDYFFPWTGDYDEYGRKQRVSLPLYTKDIYHYATAPGRTLADKVSPLFSLVSEMVHNEDFYGTEIRNADDPLVEQMWQEAKFVGTQMEPFGIRNFRRQTEAGESALTRAQNFIGIVPAPRAVEESAAERLSFELGAKNYPARALTKQETEHFHTEAAIRNGIRRGKDERADAIAALKSGLITPRELRQTIRDARLTPLQRSFKYLGPEDALKVFKIASPSEKQALKLLMVKKFVGAEKRLPAEQFRTLFAELKAEWPSRD